MSSTPQEHAQWRSSITIFSALSEFCNAGIVIHIIDMFYHSIMLVAAGTFAFFAHYADVGIYIFKSLSRLTKLLGRSLLGIEFEEDVKKHSLLHCLLDFLALLFFITTIVLLLAVSSPIAGTLAWISALIGLSIVGYTDYYITQKDSKEQLDDALSELLNCLKSQKLDNIDDLFKSLQDSYQTYKIKNKSYKLYLMLIMGLSGLLICSSVTLFATGTALIVFDIIAKIASAFLAGLALFRFYNYSFGQSKNSTENDVQSFQQFIIENKTNEPRQLADEFEKFVKSNNMDLDFEPHRSLKHI